MMNLQQAIAYGKSVGVRFYVYNDRDCLMGGTQTREEAEAMKKRFEIEDKRKLLNPPDERQAVPGRNARPGRRGKPLSNREEDYPCPRPSLSASPPTWLS